MRDVRRSLFLLLLVMGATACTAVTGKSLGQNVDDAKITAAVKSRLVEADPVNLVRIDVDTNGGVVLLNGVVPSEAIKQRASDIAWRVPGARVVINDIQVRGGY